MFAAAGTDDEKFHLGILLPTFDDFAESFAQTPG
jgi:hypothetical protein